MEGESPDEASDLADELDRIRDALDLGDSRPLQRFLDASRDLRIGSLTQLANQDSASLFLEGSVVGDYEVLDRIDEGGMGVVYRSRDRSRDRVVAWKVMRGVYAPNNFLVRRFNSEAQALLRLQHPGIVAVFATGNLEDGRPWLAMEYIDGLRLDRWMLAEHSLETKLRLICHLCEALEHAHERGVVHRDLKPSNILIDSAGRPHVLDFGLARMLDRVTQDSLTGGPNRFAGTLPWMSPEQVQGRTADERTDVHALGLILYRLVTGEMAFDLDSLDLLGAMRSVRESVPRPHPSLSGDLEVITLKALRRSPESRFQRVSQFRQELESVLAGKPIESRPPSWFEQARDLVRRHRALSAVIGVAFLGITTALLITVAMYLRLREAQRLSAAQVAILHRIIELSDPSQTPEGVTAERLLRVGIEQVESTDCEALGIDEVGVVEIGVTIANNLVKLGVPQEAIEMLGRAVRCYESRAEDPQRLAQAYRDLGFAYHSNEQFALAEEFKRRALEMRVKLLPAAHPSVLQSRDELADLLRDTSRTVLAITELERNVADAERYGTPPQLAMALRSLGATLAEVGHSRRRFECAYEADALIQRTPEADLDTRTAMRVDLALAAVESESLERGFALIREALDWSQTLPGRLSAREQLRLDLAMAHIFLQMGNVDRASVVIEHALSRCERVYGPQHDLARELRSSRAHTLSLLGHCEEALDATRASRETVRITRGEGNALWRSSTFDLANELTAQGRALEAMSVIDQLKGTSGPELPAAWRIEFEYRDARAEVLRAIGRQREAFLENQRLLELSRLLEPTPGKRVVRALHVLGLQTFRIQEPEQALKYQLAAEPISIAIYGEESASVASIRSAVAVALYGLGRIESADVYAERAVATLTRLRGAEHPDCQHMTAMHGAERRRAIDRQRRPTK